MKITTEHATSSYGIPVILDDTGQPMDCAPGLKAVRAQLGLTMKQAAEAVNANPRSWEAWEYGRFPVPTAALNVLSVMLKKNRKKSGKTT